MNPGEACLSLSADLSAASTKNSVTVRQNHVICHLSVICFFFYYYYYEMQSMAHTMHMHHTHMRIHPILSIHLPEPHSNYSAVVQIDFLSGASTT